MFHYKTLYFQFTHKHKLDKAATKIKPYNFILKPILWGLHHIYLSFCLKKTKQNKTSIPNRNYCNSKSNENTDGFETLIYFTNGRAEQSLPHREKAHFQVVRMTLSHPYWRTSNTGSAFERANYFTHVKL